MAKIVITGANRGIGLAMVREFLAAGDEVIALCRRSSDELNTTKAQVIEGVDVTDQLNLDNLAKEINDIDILISNAGLLVSDNLENIDFDNLQRQVEVNTYGPLKLALSLGPKVKKGGTFGILTSRMGSITDNTSGGQYGYRISKAAANAVGKSLAEDLRPSEVCVLLLHPGYVRTQMTDGNGLIDPTESAQGLVKIMKQKSLDDTGSFWHTNGEKLPW